MAFVAVFVAVLPFSTVSFCFSKVTVWSFVALTVTATCAVAVPQLSVTAAVPVFTAVSVTVQVPSESVIAPACAVTTLSSDDWTASTSPLAAPVSVTDREAVFALSASISMEEVSGVIALTPDCTVIWTLPSVCTVLSSAVTVAVMVAEPTFSALTVMPLMLTISSGTLVSVTFDTSAPSAFLTLIVVSSLTFSNVFPAETVSPAAKTAGTMAMTSASTTNRLRSFANVRFIPVHLFLRRASPLLL